MMKKIGFDLNIPKHMGGLSVSHHCGTVRFGSDPEKAALDQFCRSFDHDNLFVVDASFFPSSAAVNPALTIAAQAVRVTWQPPISTSHKSVWQELRMFPEKRP